MTENEAPPPIKDPVKELIEAIKTEGKDIKVITSLFKDTLVKQEQQERASMLVALYNKINQKKGELNKIRPDVVNMVEGEEKGKFDREIKSFSKAKFDERKKAEEELEKLENIFAQALLEGKFDKVKDSVK